MVNRGLQKKIVAILSEGEVLSNREIYVRVNNRWKAGFASYAQCWRMLSNMSKFTRKDVSPHMAIQFIASHRSGGAEDRSATYKLVPRKEHKNVSPREYQ